MNVNVRGDWRRVAAGERGPVDPANNVRTWARPEESSGFEVWPVPT